MRKALFFFWGFVYWPFLIVGLAAFGISALFYATGDWLHDLLVGWAYPGGTGEKGDCPSCRVEGCECGAVR